MLLTRKQTEARTWFLHNHRSVFYIILVFSLWDQMYRVRDLFNKSGCLIISGRLTDRPGKTEAIKWTDHVAAVLTQTSVLTVRAGKRCSCCSVLSRSCTHSETFPVMLGGALTRAGAAVRGDVPGLVCAVKDVMNSRRCCSSQIKAYYENMV